MKRKANWKTKMSKDREHEYKAKRRLDGLNANNYYIKKVSQLKCIKIRLCDDFKGDSL